VSSSCPVCKKTLKSTEDAKKHRPFCSPRCRQVDLGRWLNEEYRVPVEEDPGKPAEHSAPTHDEDD
jgi:endogenous inhibitor of DNA gyrase (YacG/DUF329 family)